MSNFVRLPSGRGVNTENISSWNNITQLPDVVTREKDDALLILFTDEADGSSWFTGADARALYAYLDSIAVAIGEDGKPVEAEAPKTHALPAPLTSDAVEFMRALDRAFPSGLSTMAACDDFNVTSDELDFMAHKHYIIATPLGWRSTSRGFDFLAELDAKATGNE